MGYEVLGDGADVHAGGPAQAPDDVHEWRATPAAPAVRHRSRRGPVAVLVAAVVAGVLAAAHGSSTRDGDPRPSVTSDLDTTLSVGHVPAGGFPFQARAQSVRNALGGGTFHGITYTLLPDEPVSRYSGESPVSDVAVAFDQRLDAEGELAFRRALERVAPGATVTTLPGSAVEISVPAALGTSPCLALEVSTGLPILDLRPDVRQGLATMLSGFSPRAADGRVTLGYLGPRRSMAQLRDAGAILAGACGAAPGDVSYRRMPGYTS